MAKDKGSGKHHNTSFPGAEEKPASHKKKRKTDHEKSKGKCKKSKALQKAEFKTQEISVEEPLDISHEKTKSKKRNDSVKKVGLQSMLETAKSHQLKSYLAGQGLSLKEWKKKRKEEYKIWKEAKEARKLKRLEKNKATENCLENKEITGNGKNYTVSIALPGSILDNAQSPELKTYLAGQIARAAAVFNVNEIVVFEENAAVSGNLDDEDGFLRLRQKRGSVQLAKILQFLECPQYLRRYFFPLQKDLEHAGVLNPLDLPSHLRFNDVSPYREGVVLDKPVKSGRGSYAYIGFPKSVLLDKAIEPHVRVTVKLDEQKEVKKHYAGTVVSPSSPYKQDGIYWGYSVRLADSLGAVFSKCPFKDGYDLTIGTSDKGDHVDPCVFPQFRHLLIVFGGLKGLEASLESDETLTVDDPRYLFHHYLNTCPSQGSRTIRTEEAILITLSILGPRILQCQMST